MVARSRKVAGRLGQGVAHLMKKNGVTVIQASARLAGAGRLALDNGGTLSARHIILATGARARELPALPLGERIWAYRQALVPDAVPKSLLVVGAGAIGAEFASFYRAVGAEVTLIDMTAEILPQEDAEISQLARKSFEKQGIRVLTQCAVTASSPTATGVKVTLEQQGKRSDWKSSASSSPPASSATSRTWAWKARASRWKEPHRHRRPVPHRRAGRLRHRRRGRRALAGAQGQP